MKKKSMLILGILIVFIAVVAVVLYKKFPIKNKEEKFIEELKESVKNYNGTFDYENDVIEINWTTQNMQENRISFDYHDNVIEYNSGEIKNYKEAESVISHTIYSVYLMKAVLRVNGYSDEEIQTFFSNEEKSFDYEINGIELKEIGKSKEFTSEDGTMTITVSPKLIRINISKANLNKTNDSSFEPKNTTIEEIIANLQSDDSFTQYKSGEKTIYTNDVDYDGEYINISHTDYTDEFHYVSFPFENGIVTYEDSEIENYSDAEIALSHQLFASQMISIALRVNGYTTEQIQAYFSNEENSLNYEVNGLELKEIGDSKTFTNNNENDKLTITPMSIKINVNKAYIEK